MDFTEVQPLLELAVSLRIAADQDQRQTLANAGHDTAFRLFNGFSEGAPGLVVDIYGRTLVVHDYSDKPANGGSLIQNVFISLQNKLGWLRAGLLKSRTGSSQEERRGKLVFGDAPDSKIVEHGVWYAIDLTLNRDTGFYLDTRNLRKWLVDNIRGRSVLNTFAYTGSFGIAAAAGGASRVVQVDRNRRFLDLAKASYALNRISVNERDLLARDFFPAVAGFKNAKQYFDCVILDPPFFSSTSKGRVDQLHDSVRLINKVRPLVNDGGWLIAINNALYVSGREYKQTLDHLCRDGYLQIADLINVPQDFAGFNRAGNLITDPAPFNHSTKIAILRVKRKP